MKLVADESVERQIVDRLRQDGHQVQSIVELAPSIADSEVLDLANRESAVLLTADKDFGELVFRLRRVTTGIVLIRLAGLSGEQKSQVVARVIQEHAADLPGAFTVITPALTRVRSRQVEDFSGG